MTIRRTAALTAALSLTLTAFAALPASAAATIPDGASRLAGATRYETAVAASHLYAPNVDAVFVTTGENFPDALAASAAAASRGVPLLLTPTAALPSTVLEEVNRLKPKNIYVVGGPGAVSDAVVTSLKTVAPTARTSGQDRYATANALNTTFFSKPDAVFVATGTAFADALTAGAAAGAGKAPVFLVDGTQPTIPTATATAIAGMGMKSINIAGETGAVSAGIEQQLKTMGVTVNRFGGATRYETATLLNQKFFPGAKTVFLATGLDFPDALAGAAVAGGVNAPLYLTAQSCVPVTPHAAITALAPTKTVSMGGTAVVSAAAAANTTCGVSPTPSPSPSTSASPSPKPSATGDTATKDCKDFKTQAAAQTWYDSAVKDVDPASMTMKPNSNGKVCKNYAFPSASPTSTSTSTTPAS